MTKAEHDLQSAMRELGCIVCRLDLGLHSPASIHHILRGGRKIGEYDVLPLCRLHHQGGCNGHRYTSRHPWRKVFILRYGTEEYLLGETLKLIDKGLA
ncbi:MAG: Ref family protein [Gallionella sp.]|nr:Ref family protein [Gallionella sp.]